MSRFWKHALGHSHVERDGCVAAVGPAQCVASGGFWRALFVVAGPGGTESGYGSAGWADGAETAARMRAGHAIRRLREEQRPGTDRSLVWPLSEQLDALRRWSA